MVLGSTSHSDCRGGHVTQSGTKGCFRPSPGSPPPLSTTGQQRGPGQQVGLSQGAGRAQGLGPGSNLRLFPGAKEGPLEDFHPRGGGGLESWPWVPENRGKEREVVSTRLCSRPSSPTTHCGKPFPTSEQTHRSQCTSHFYCYNPMIFKNHFASKIIGLQEIHSIAIGHKFFTECPGVLGIIAK